MEVKINRKLILLKKINYFVEASKLVEDFIIWNMAKNKEEISWEDSRIGNNYYEDFRLVYLKEGKSKKDYSKYYDFIERVKGEAKPILDQFFSEKPDLLSLFSILKNNYNKNTSFFNSVFTYSDKTKIEDYTREEFHLHLQLGVLEFFIELEEENYNISGKLAEAKNSKEALKVLESFNYFQLLSSDIYKPEEITLLLRSLLKWEEIFEDIYPILTSCQKIIEKYSYILEDDFKEKLLDFEKEDLAFAKGFLKDIGVDKIYIRDKDPIYVQLSLINNRSAGVRFSTISFSNNILTLGLYFDEHYQNSSNEIDKDKLQETLKALADPTRFGIINLLRQRPYYVKELADALFLTAPTLSHHLYQLQVVGLIGLEIQGRRVYYYLKKEAFKKLGARLVDFIEEEVNND